MTLKPLRAAGLALGLAAVAVAAALGGATRPTDPAPAPQAVAQPVPAPAPAVPAGGQLLVWCGGNPVLLRPDGTEVRKLPGTGFEDAPGLARLHPDGRRFAYSADEQPRPKVGSTRTEVYVRGLDAPGLGRRVPVNGAGVAWSADGTELYGHFTSPEKDTAWEWTEEHAVGEFAFPKSHALIDRSPDGRHLLALWVNNEKKERAYTEVQLMRADRTVVAVVSDPRDYVSAARFAPNGRSILLCVTPPADAADPGRPVVSQVSMKDLSVATVTRLPKGATLESVCGSPDGNRVAYTWWRDQPGVPGHEFVYQLTVCDLRGENAATILTRRGTALGSVDWR